MTSLHRISLAVLGIVLAGPSAPPPLRLAPPLSAQATAPPGGGASGAEREGRVDMWTSGR